MATPHYEPGQVFLYFPGFSINPVWVPIRDKFAALEALRPRASEWFQYGDDITVYVCTRKRRGNWSRGNIIPDEIFFTYDATSWAAGELTLDEYADLLEANQEVSGGETPKGDYPDDFKYKLKLLPAGGALFVRPFELANGDPLPVPVYDPPTAEESIIEKQAESRSEGVEPYRENRHNVWHFRAEQASADLNDGKHEQGWKMPEDRVYWQVPITPDTYGKHITIQAEEESGDSQRLEQTVYFDECTLVNLAADSIPSPIDRQQNDLNNTTRGAVILKPVGAWSLPSFSDGFAQSDQGDPLRDYRADLPNTRPALNADPFVISYRYEGNIAQFFQNHGEITFDIVGAQGLPIPNAPRWNPLRPRYDVWCFAGYRVQVSTVVQLGTGFATWYARSRFNQPFYDLDSNTLTRPEYRGYEAIPHDPEEEQRWYRVYNSKISLGEAGNWFPEDSQYAQAGDNTRFTHPFLLDQFARVPYAPGSVPVRVSIIFEISASYIMGNEYQKCNRFKFAQPWTTVCHIDSPIPANGLVPADFYDAGIPYGSSEIFRLPTPAGADPRPDGLEGLFVPEQFYHRAEGVYDFDKTPWASGLLQYVPNVRPQPAPDQEPPKKADHSKIPDITGYFDEYKRTEEQLQHLNPVFRYAKKITTRMAKMYWSSMERGRKPSDDGAKDFAALFTQGCVMAAAYFLKTMDEALLVGNDDGYHSQAFALYLTTDFFKPVPEEELEGENGEKPLYGFPLINGWKDAQGEVGLGEGEEAEEEMEDFATALFFSAALSITNNLDDALRPDNEDQAYFDHVQRLLDEKGAKASYMKPVYGSGKLLGFWRI